MGLTRSVQIRKEGKFGVADQRWELRTVQMQVWA